MCVWYGVCVSLFATELHKTSIIQWSTDAWWKDCQLVMGFVIFCIDVIFFSHPPPIQRKYESGKIEKLSIYMIWKKKHFMRGCQLAYIWKILKNLFVIVISSYIAELSPGAAVYRGPKVPWPPLFHRIHSVISYVKVFLLFVLWFALSKSNLQCVTHYFVV